MTHCVHAVLICWRSLQLPSSRYVHDISLTAILDITTDTVAFTLLHGWISRFGCPQTIATDQFESQLFQPRQNSAVYTCHKTVHHSASYGLVGCLHWMLKAAIMCHADDQRTDALPIVFLSIRASFKEDLQASVTDLIYS